MGIEVVPVLVCSDQYSIPSVPSLSSYGNRWGQRNGHTDRGRPRLLLAVLYEFADIKYEYLILTNAYFVTLNGSYFLTIRRPGYVSKRTLGNQL